MSDNMLALLDCTLRDGGYINDWNWDFHRAKDIISMLVKAKIDFVEVGFLRNVSSYDPNITVCNYIEELNKLLPEDDNGKTVFSAMAMRSNYDVSKLSPYSGKGIEMIRITAHDYDINDGMEFAKQVKDKGYKLSINPINIMGYSDEQILEILKQINEIQPYQFSIVDTFGSMKRRDLDRIVSLVDNNLDGNIRVALHLHENMSLSFSLAQNFIDRHLSRSVTIDGSLLGMGRTPGNLPVELIADYLNDYTGKTYDIDYLMDAIQDYIAPMKGESNWGYMPAYFLSAKYNLHRNYAEHYLKKGDLTNRDINHILARFDRKKATAFDPEYADTLYEEYKYNFIDDLKDRQELQKLLCDKKILIIAPGSSITEYCEKIKKYIAEEKPIVISVNFVPELFHTDYSFFSNNKRMKKQNTFKCKTIVTSNLRDVDADYCIDYNSLSGAFDQGCNSLIMLLKLLVEIDAGEVIIAGADGYVSKGNNYYDSSFRSYTEHGNRFNIAVADAIYKLGINVNFLTPSAYEIKDK